MGCDIFTAETVAINKPFRALMRRLGVGEGGEVAGRDRNESVICEAVYEVWREEWRG